MDTNQIYFLAAVLNSICCAYPLNGICKLRGQPKTAYHYYEVIRFSYFCMSFWFAYGVQSHNSLPFIANLVGFSLSGGCLVAYAIVFREIRKVFRHLTLGCCIVFVFSNLHLDYLIPLGCLVTVRLYFYCLADLSTLKNTKSCKKLDIFDNCVNCLNTIAWTVYGISDQDVFIVAAFFFGFTMYAQIFACAIFYEFLNHEPSESTLEDSSQAKDTQA